MSPRLVLMSLACALLSAAPAYASGQSPPMPLPDQSFSDQAACIAHLEQLHTEDVARHEPQPTDLGNGETRQQLVHSDGIVLADGTARYIVRINREFRGPLPEFKIIRTNASYTENTWVCSDGLLTGIYVSGYYHEGQEPM